MYVLIDHIITKHFCRLEELDHYSLVGDFFTKGEKAARQNERYNKRFDRKNEIELFVRLPEYLDVDPVWWCMPWADMTVNTNLNDNARQVHIDKFINLLNSVYQKGLNMETITVHRLINGKKRRYINLDGNHRLAILAYLTGHSRMVSVNPVITVNRKDIEDLPLVKSGRFSINDAYKWFDLSWSF